MASRVLSGVAVLLIAGAGVPASAMRQPSTVSKYVLGVLHASGKVRFQAAVADLNGHGRKEVVVYVTDPAFCGSGGCRALVLEPDGAGYRVRMNATITRRPIRVLATRSIGWRDLGVMVPGGGIDRPYEAKMRFDGRRYPSNPTIPPAIPMTREAGHGAGKWAMYIFRRPGHLVAEVAHGPTQTARGRFRQADESNVSSGSFFRVASPP